MTTYLFTLILDTDPSDDQVDRLYGYFGLGGDAPDQVRDVTLGVSNGVPFAACTVQAETFDEAVRLVLPALRSEGLSVVRVEVDQEDISALEAA